MWDSGIFAGNVVIIFQIFFLNEKNILWTTSKKKKSYKFKVIWMPWPPNTAGVEGNVVINKRLETSHLGIGIEFWRAGSMCREDTELNFPRKATEAMEINAK